MTILLWVNLFKKYKKLPNVPFFPFRNFRFLGMTQSVLIPVPCLFASSKRSIILEKLHNLLPNPVV